MKPATLPARTLSLLYERQLTLARFDERLFSLIAYYCLCHNHNGGGGGGRGGGDGEDTATTGEKKTRLSHSFAWHNP